MTTLGIPRIEFETKQNLIDILLCDRRNEIAHGRASFPSCDDVLDLHKKVLGMMEALRSVTISEIRIKGYRHNGSASANG